MFKSRIKKVQDKLKEKNIGAFLITNLSNIFYLTGLKECPGDDKVFLMVVSKNNFRVIVPQLYQSEAERAIAKKNVVILKGKSSLFKEALKILKKYHKIGFEKEDLKYSEYDALKKNLKGKKLIPVSKFIEDFRKIKDREEIKRIKKAAEITDKTFYRILKIIKPGLTEKFIQRKIIEIIENLGAERVAFEPVVSSGKGSAEPHYLASNKKIKNNDILLIDMGVRYEGYDSDFTRTVFVGKASQRFKKLYNIVLETQKMAIKKCKVGYPIKKLYQDSVSSFEKYKEDKYFIHSLGHGVGVDIHEFPIIGIKDQGKFENGMVFAIEPGLYHKNFGGIRIEDLCLMNGSCEALSKFPKKIIEI